MKTHKCAHTQPIHRQTQTHTLTHTDLRWPSATLYSQEIAEMGGWSNGPELEHYRTCPTPSYPYSNVLKAWLKISSLSEPLL